MIVLFVHGMGRTPASGWPMLRRLRSAGHRTAVFSYAVHRESVRQVADRLSTRLAALLRHDDVVLIGHSLGGVLVREALASLATSGRKPMHLFLLGSPVQPSRLAAAWSANPIFRWATGDCGRLLASAERMAGVALPSIPCTGIAGTRGVSLSRKAFGNETNDGVVALSEVNATWLSELIRVPVVHTLLPSSHHVSSVVIDRLQRHFV